MMAKIRLFWLPCSGLLLLGCASVEKQDQGEPATPEASAENTISVVQEIPTRSPISQPDGKVRWEKTGRSVTITRIPVGFRPDGLQWAGGAVWVTGQRLLKIDPSSGRIIARLEKISGDIVVGDDAIWSLRTGFTDCRLLQIDPASEKVMTQIPGFRGRSGTGTLASGAGSVWVYQPQTVYRIDPKTARVIATVKGIEAMEGVGGASLAVDPGGVWVLTRKKGAVWSGEPLFCGKYVLSRISAAENRVTETIELSHNICFDLAVDDDGTLWVTQSRTSGDPVADISGNDRYSRLLRIDPKSSRIAAAIPMELDTAGITIGGGFVWVASMYGQVLRIDRASNKVIEAVETATHLQGKRAWRSVSLLFAQGSLWLAGLPEPLIYRIDVPESRSEKVH